MEEILQNEELDGIFDGDDAWEEDTLDEQEGTTPEEQNDDGENPPEGGPEGETGNGPEGAHSEPGDREGEATLTVKYNGEERRITLQEAAVLAQKGLNYDKVAERAARLSEDPGLKVLDSYAKRNGMTREQYVSFLAEQEKRLEREKMEEQGIPKAVAERLQELEEKNRRREEQEQEKASEEAEKALFRDFVREYPGVKEFPPEVVEKIRSGETPLNAYRAWENRELKMKLQAQQSNIANRQKTVGPANGNAAGEEGDDFLKAFLAEF